MPLHLKKCSNIKITNFSGQSPNTYVKENHILSRERITVMITVAFTEKKTPNMKFVFKGKGTRTKLNPTPNVTVQWTLKGSYRLQHMQEFVRKAVPDVPYMLFSQLKKIYSLDDYSVHLDPSISDALIKKDKLMIRIFITRGSQSTTMKNQN